MADKNPKSAIESLLNELKTVKNDTTIGNLAFKELTYEQQRKILSGKNSSITDFLPNSIITLNEYIKKNVEFTDDQVKTDILTIDVRPFILNVLRTISVGRDIKLDDKVYQLYEVQPDDLVSKLEPEVYKKDTFELVITVPTIREDTVYNSLLVNALSQYRNRKTSSFSESDATAINDLYIFYDNMKYIKSFTVDGVTYDYIELSTSDKINLLNQFPQQIISLIRRYKKQVEECTTKAFTVTSSDDGSTRELEHELQLFTTDEE